MEVKPFKVENETGRISIKNIGDEPSFNYYQLKAIDKDGNQAIIDLPTEQLVELKVKLQIIIDNDVI